MKINNIHLEWKIKESKKVIRATHKRWSKTAGVAFTGRKDSTVLMHLILDVTKGGLPAMFIDHGLHFDETIENLEILEKLWKLKIIRVTDKDLMKKLTDTKNKRSKVKIVTQLKIQVIRNTIKEQKWKALYTAIRWDEQYSRRNEVYISKRLDHFRIHPILHWTEKDIWDYIRMNNIPYISLYDEGYRSIGERIFTKKSSEYSIGERSGRDKDKEIVMDRLRKLGYF